LVGNIGLVLLTEYEIIWANFLTPDVFKKIVVWLHIGLSLSSKKKFKKLSIEKRMKKQVVNVFGSGKATQHMSNVVYTFCVKRKKVRLG
jgi:hypothetical protein